MAEIIHFDNGRCFFSDKTPQALQNILNEAIHSRSPADTEQLLLDARNQWPLEPDAHIALYKFWFVQGQYRYSEKAVMRAIYCASKELRISHNYWTWTKDTADWSVRKGANRLALFSLKALGVVRLRSEKVMAAHKVLAKLAELDPTDEIGGGAFLQIALSILEDNE